MRFMTRLAIVATLLMPGLATAQSGVQTTPDGEYTLVSKNVGDQRWAITRTSGGQVTGNVFVADGAPQFVSCTVDDDAEAAAGNVALVCQGSDRCSGGTCASGEWAEIASVQIPESFFGPGGGGSGSAPAGDGSASSGIRQSPDGTHALINKDIGGERWAISRRTSDGTVTGNVFRAGEAPQFVWCEQTGATGDEVTLRCEGADACAETCSEDDWSELAAVTLPLSFFEYAPEAPSSSRTLRASNADELELAWEHTAGGGSPGGPVVSGDIVYATTTNRILWALDRETGWVKWQFQTGAIPFSGVTLVDDGSVLFADGQNNVYRLNGTTGETIWHVNVRVRDADAVWSPPSFRNGRVFVGVASLSDNPCSKGRTVALDLETGEQLWERVNVPERICDTDTTLECTEDAECGEGACIEAIGAGVTSTPAPDESGDYLYVNTVGCYTFPSVGDSDAMMKLDARTGETIWLNRVDPPEQFGFCDDGVATECSTLSMCNPSGMCEQKGAYHDFGFLNGPVLVEVDGELLVVSGSKNGTLYAFDSDTGEIEWTNEIAPKPVSPGFAGFGLFNGAIAYENGRIFAALNHLIPNPDPLPDRFQAFDVRNGRTVWSDDIGAGYGHVAATNDIIVSGTNDERAIYLFNGRTGERIQRFEMPNNVSSRAAISGNALYVGYGILSNFGGVRAYRLP